MVSMRRMRMVSMRRKQIMVSMRRKQMVGMRYDPSRWSADAQQPRWHAHNRC